MKIAVLVKQVPDLEALIHVKADGLEIENRYVCSFFDEVAIEAALEIRKVYPDCELLALAAGGKRQLEALRRAVAMGIDRVEQLGDESLDGADSLVVAAALAARLGAIEPDLVLCGKQAGDDERAAVGPMLAELLGMPYVAAAISLELDPKANTARIERAVEGGSWTIESGMPLLVSAEKGLAEPHLPVVTRVMKAMKAKIENIPLADLFSDDALPAGGTRRLRVTAPPERAALTMIASPFPDNVAELVARLDQAGLLPETGAGR
jgi:electron transfer flavoprotein beta subunit